MKPFRPLLLSLLLAAALPAAAAPENSELGDIQKAINAAENDLRQKQDAHKKAQAALGRTEAALAKVRAEIAELNRQQQVSWNRLQVLQKDLNRLQAEVAAARAQVARLLTGNYKNRQPHAVVLFLKNADGSQKSRFLRYSRYINAANDNVLKKLVGQQNELAKQQAAINAELDKLKQLSTAKQVKMKQLGNEKLQVQSVSDKLDKDIATQNQKLAKLRADERRLNQVIADIAARDAAKRKAETEARRQEAERRMQAQKQPERPRTAPPAPGQTAPPSGLTEEDLALEAPQGTATRQVVEHPVVSAPAEDNGLSRRQGSLPRPVSGSVNGRFGQARASGGVWRGLFFATGPASVHSVAAGRVSFAAPLSGYGNTVIIDHGGGYMSVYTGLSSIGAGAGSRVAERQIIGTSGTLPAGEQGLYFELRFRNRPVNPQSWLR